MPNFFHFEGSVNDEVIDLTNFCKVIKRDTNPLSELYTIELVSESREVIYFKNKEERDESYENLKRTLLTS